MTTVTGSGAVTTVFSVTLLVPDADAVPVTFLREVTALVVFLADGSAVFEVDLDTF